MIKILMFVVIAALIVLDIFITFQLYRTSFANKENFISKTEEDIRKIKQDINMQRLSMSDTVERMVECAMLVRTKKKIKKPKEDKCEKKKL